jgi:hypothetical protein
MSIIARNSRNQNDDDQYTNSQRKTGGWSGGASNGNDQENANGRSTFSSSGSRDGFESNAGGFRGNKWFLLAYKYILSITGSRENGGGGFNSGRDRGKIDL